MCRKIWTEHTAREYDIIRLLVFICGHGVHLCSDLALLYWACNLMMSYGNEAAHYNASLLAHLRLESLYISYIVSTSSLFFFCPILSNMMAYN